MFVRNGTECYDLQPSDFGMSSAARNQIVLLYHGKPWGDLLLEVERDMCECVPDSLSQTFSITESIDSCDIAVVFNVQKRRVGMLARVNTKLRFLDMEHFENHFALHGSNEEIAAILDQFFDSGAKGLSDEHRIYYQNVYGLWRKVH